MDDIFINIATAIGIATICFFILLVMIFIVVKATKLLDRKHETKTDGYLHVRSDEDGPYLFLEPSIPIEDICNRDTITLTVVHK